MRYHPPFDEPQSLDLARRRDLIVEDETVLDGLDRVARTLAEIDRTQAGTSTASDAVFASQLRSALLAGRIAVSSQLLSAAGRTSEVSACTVLPTGGTTDEERLRRVLAEADVASRRGMGCGIDLSDFDDPVAALLAINDDIGHLDRELTAASLRPPALMVTCSSTHPDIEDFIVAKEGADFGSWVANISVRVADEASWMRLRSTLAASAHYNGEPGVLFADTADADNPTPELPTTSTAPCAEVFLAPGERCVFVTVNLAAHVVDGWFDWAAFRASVRLAVRTGDAAVELAALDASEVVAQRRRIGVGVCGFHTALIELGIPYARSIDFAARISETLTYTAHDASAALAIARGPFPSWAGSRWQDRSWLTRKADRRVGAVPETTWDSLHERIGTTGIRNAAVVAYPPTGVIANLLGVSRSYEPHYSLVGHTGVVSAERGGARIVPEVADLLTGSGGLHVRDAILGDGDGQLPGAGAEHLLACARQLPASVHLGVHAAFSGLADESGSKTVNLPGDVSVAEVEALLEEVRRLGLKGVSVFRDGSLDRPSKIRGVA